MLYRRARASLALACEPLRKEPEAAVARLTACQDDLRRVLERDTPAGAPAVLVIAAVRRTGRVGIFHHVVLFCSRNTNTRQPALFV